jgi:hypothetical protein
MGWTLDVKKGVVSLTTAANQAGAKQSAQVYEGVFQVLQNAGEAAPTTDLALRGGAFGSICGGGLQDETARASASAASVRHLWGKGKGRFRTVGKFASASVRGTEWLTEDRCDGTLVQVKQGIVDVFDFLLQKTVQVRAGARYLARRASP